MKPDYDEQVEIDVLAAMCEKRELRHEGLEVLEVEDFHFENHRNLFRIILNAASRFERPDGTLDYEALMSEDPIMRERLSGWFLAPKLVRHTERIAELRKMRLDRDLRLLVEQAEAEADPAARRDLLYSGLGAIDRGGAEASPKEVADGVMAQLLEIASGEKKRGMLTGWPDIDRKVSGLVKGRSVVVALRPGGGKTAIGTQVAERVVNQGYKSLILTTEMTVEQYLFRLAITHANITLKDLENRKIVAEKLAFSRRYLDNWVQENRLKIESKPQASPEDLRRLIHRHEPDFVVVDYIQRMRTGRNLSEHEEVSAVSMEVDALKLSEDVALMICAQLNREVESRKSQRPKMSDLRYSGQIEQDADVILLGHQTERVIELYCAKNRHGQDHWISSLYFGEGSLYISDQPVGRGAAWIADGNTGGKPKGSVWEEI